MSKYGYNGTKDKDSFDILFFGDIRCSSTLVTVPHPRIAERDFVLRPLRQIATPTLRRSFPEYF